jgi:hypothetical protein
MLVTNEMTLETGVPGLELVVETAYEPPQGRYREVGSLLYYVQWDGGKRLSCGGRWTFGAEDGPYSTEFFAPNPDDDAAETLALLRRLGVIGPRDPDDEEDHDGRAEAQAWADEIVRKAGLLDEPEPLWLVVDYKLRPMAEGSSKDAAIAAYRVEFDPETECDPAEAGYDTEFWNGGAYLMRASDRLAQLWRWGCAPSHLCLEWDGRRLEVKGV